MFTKFLSRVKAMPPRSGDWASRLGPAALMGYNGGARSSGTKLLERFYSSSRECDMYAELTFHEPGPVECPPETVVFLPTIKCGDMLDAGVKEEEASRDDWYVATTEATTDLLEKGYIPISAGGDGSATLAMVEAYKRLFPTEEVVLIHFSARPSLETPDKPVRVLLEKNLLKGVIEIGNRCVCSEDRKVRKQHKVLYMDIQAIYAKGIFCIRDIRNDYPVFISINADVLDPAFAPGVEEPVPGGMTVRDLLHVMAGIRGPKVAGIDIHGYNPALDVRRSDGLGLTEMALSKVLKESVVKAFSITTTTEQEGMERIRIMQRQGTLSDNPYPDH